MKQLNSRSSAVATLLLAFLFFPAARISHATDSEMPSVLTQPPEKRRQAQAKSRVTTDIVIKRKVRPKQPVDYGFGLHVRGIFVHPWLLNLFLDASTPLNSAALGAEFLRRKGRMDLIGSIDFGFYSPKDGNYIGNNEDPSLDTDYVHFRNLNVLAFNVHLIRHEPIRRWVSFVWGGGLGIGVVFGSVLRASGDPDRCNARTKGDESQCYPIGMDPQNPKAFMTNPQNRGREVDESPDNPLVFKEDSIPPVVPVLHLLIGFNFKLSRHVELRVDGGFRNAFYIGSTVNYIL